MTTQASIFPRVDAAGLGFSALCVAHCLALPLLAATLPLAGALAENEAVHQALVVFAAFAAGIGVLQSAGRVRGVFAVTAGVGVLLLACGAFVEALHDLETPLTVLGAVVLAGGHVYRWRAAGLGAARATG